MKRLLMIVAIVFVSVLLCGVLWYSFADVSVTGNIVADSTPLTNSVSCTDSDGGVFSLEKGIVTSKNFLGIPKKYADRCTDIDGKDAVREYYCDAGKVKWQKIVCGNGCDDGACLSNSEGGSMKISVIDAETQRPLKDAEVTLYDDSLTEIETKKTTQSGVTTFTNSPLQFSKEVLSLYQEKGKSAPQVNKLDTRTYVVDVAIPGYASQVAELEFIEGKDSMISISLKKLISNDFRVATGNAVIDNFQKTESSVSQSSEDSGVLLKMGSQESLLDQSQCKILVEELTAEPMPEDFKPFLVKGFLRTTKHCSGTFRVTLSFAPDKVVTITGKGSVPFTINSIETSHGNAAGGLDCPFLKVEEIVKTSTGGASISVGFRMPVLACNDPLKCPYGEQQTACDRYFNGDCAASSREGMCEWEREKTQEDPWCTSIPKNGGAPAGGGRGNLDYAMRQDVGKQCCFCGIDAYPKDEINKIQFEQRCQSFFDKTIEPFRSDPSFKCEVNETFALQLTDKVLKQVSKMYKCKDNVKILISAHGNPVSSSRDTATDRSSQYFNTNQNLFEVSRICLASFPHNNIDISSISCETFNYWSDMKKYLSRLKSFVGKDQTLTLNGNQLSGFFADFKDNAYTLKRTVVITPACMTIKLGSCKKEGTSCSPPNNYNHPCLDENRKETTQRCCSVVSWARLIGMDGAFTKPGVTQCSDYHENPYYLAP